MLQENIGAAVPEDALLGEEFGRLGDSERLWILDPIDGTSLRGAFESSWPRLGDETRLSVTSTSIMKEAVLDALDDDSRGRLPREASIAPPSPLPLVELVRSEIDGFLAECCHVWDHAPWILLVQEAGGRFTDRTGGHGGDAGGGLYSNSGLHMELLAAIGYPTRP